MRVLGVRIENWRGIARLELRFESRISVLHGPNETGKSTVQEAIRLAFLGDANSQAAELKELVPWGSSAKAHVEVELETGAGERLRIEKSFPKGDARLYRLSATAPASPGSRSTEPGGEDRGSLLAEGRGVQERVFAYLSVPADAVDLFSLLWIGQGEALSLFDRRPSDSSVNGSAQTLIKSLIKENLLSGPAEELYRELEGEYAQVILKNGRPKKGSRLGELEVRVQELTQEVGWLEEELSTTEESRKELAGIEERLRDGEERETAQRGLLERLRRKQEAVAKLEPKRAAFERLEKRYQSLLGVEVREEKSSGRVSELFARKSEALSDWKRELGERVERASTLEERKKQLDESADAARITNRKLLDELNEGQRRIRERELRLEASGLTLRIRTGSGAPLGLTVSRDEGEAEQVEIEEADEWKAARSIRVSLASGPEIESSGPLSREEWSSITTELEGDRAGLSRRLEELGCSSIEEAASAYDAYLSNEQERSRIVAELAGIVGSEGLDAQRREVSSAEEELSRERTVLDRLGFDPQEASAAAEEGEASAAERVRRAARDLFFTIHELEECRSQRDELLEGRDRDEFARERRAAKEELDHELGMLAEMEPIEFETVTPREVNDAQRRLDELVEQTQATAHRRTALETILSRSGGLVERHEQKGRLLSLSNDELAAERQRVDAIALLIRLMDEEKAEIDRNIVEPLKERLTTAFREVVGERYSGVEVSDQLGIGEVSVAGLEDRISVGTSLLSYGTREQLSFLFRLLVAQYLSAREPQVMMLDDTFVNTDPTRRERLFEMMEEDPSNLQFLLFTCHGDEYAAFRDRSGVAFLDLLAPA